MGLDKKGDDFSTKLESRYVTADCYDFAGSIRA